jgi:hypothetical protein
MSKPTGKLAFAYQTIAKMEARIEALLAERDALAKDAERYRFLMRELGGSVSQVVMGSPVFSNEDVDAAIDAALQGEQP